LAATTSRAAEFDEVQAKPADSQMNGHVSQDGNGVRFQREARREFRHQLSVACAIAASWLTWIVPACIRYRIADRCGDLFYRFSPTYRDNVRANIEQVLGPRATFDEINRCTREIFRVSARNFTDLLLVPHKQEGQMSRETILGRGNYGIIDQALTDGHGVLFLTGHLGAFDLMGQVLHERGYKLTVVTARTTARFLFDAVTYLRHARGMELVEATPSGVRRTIQAIRRGECAVFVSDRDFLQSGRKVNFFGAETTLPPGIVRIARETGATIVPIFGERLANGHMIHIDPGFKVERTQDIEADLPRGLNNVVEILERAIGNHPDQWVMFQRVWPVEPVAPVRVFPVGSPLENDILERAVDALPGRRQQR
jgi:lauroyl/myristoyl acyltransferase